MQAYQSPPCPYCGATWNQPGAQACANCRNPLLPPQESYAPPGYPPGAVEAQAPPQYAGQPASGYPGYMTYAPGVPPPVAGRYLPKIAAGAVAAVCLLVLFVGILPVIASGQIASANQSLVAAASHQDKIDAVFTQYFNAKSYTTDYTAYKDQFDKMAKSFGDGLTQVKSDEAAVGSADLRLTFLQWLAPSKLAGISAARHRLNTTLAGMKQADQALTAAVNEAKAMQPYIDARIDYNKMGAALGKGDWAGASAAYADAQQKIGLAMSSSHAAGLPPQIAKQVSSFNDVLSSGDGLIQATHAKDAAGMKKYTDAMNVALKALSSPEETVPADYDGKTFGPMQKAYDTAMTAIKTGS